MSPSTLLAAYPSIHLLMSIHPSGSLRYVNPSKNCNIDICWKEQTIMCMCKVLPPQLKMDYNPMKTIDISPTKTIVIGLTNQLRLSYITMEHHLVCVCLRCCFFVVPGGAEKHLRPKRRFGDWTKSSLGNSLPYFHNEVMPIVNKTTGWWCQPLWKIWVRHLGLLFPIYGQNVPTNQK